ncbi:hypothetical protein [Levilactobacillus bambusae]|uniref:Uncharacterized protein n=1 Tax=Levilactobacillus bambusae TaxID=2024736 RepID=A0A2V1N1H5_9LACO|nr:hypothetical protein [Levilactobacillus bambusae]PWG00226.1 hypothetical protein DCM90_04640 [Levilactobacillus bambusae]
MAMMTIESLNRFGWVVNPAGVTSEGGRYYPVRSRYHVASRLIDPAGNDFFQLDNGDQLPSSAIYLEGEPFFNRPTPLSSELAVVQDPHGTTLLSDAGVVLTVAEFGASFPVTDQAVDIFGDAWYKTTSGWLKANTAFLAGHHKFQHPGKFAMPKRGKVKRAKGITGQTQDGQDHHFYPLGATVTLVGTAKDDVGQIYLHTTDDTYLPLDSVWQDGQSLFERVTGSGDYIGVITVEDTTPINRLGRPLHAVRTGTAFDVHHCAVDAFGRYFIDVGGDRWLAMTACVALQRGEAWQPNKKEILHLASPDINQRLWQLPQGSEAAALFLGLKTVGSLAHISFTEWLTRMPISPNGNPNRGFSGDPALRPEIESVTITPAALIDWGDQFGDLRNLHGATTAFIRQRVQLGHPVIAYVTANLRSPEYVTTPFGTQVKNGQAVLVDGISGSLLHLNDPLNGARWVPESRFEHAYNCRQWAIEVLPPRIINGEGER